MFGGACFAIPLLLTPAGIIPSVLLGAAAFGASELILGEEEKKPVIVNNRNISKEVEKARAINKEIQEMQFKIEDIGLQNSIKDVSKTAESIINTVEQNPTKFKKVENFFDYYLPVTIKILKKYDVIENQRLVSSDSKKIMEQAKELIAEVDKAFKKQLASMYQADIVDTDAEMKVLDMMLKSDGLDSNNIDLDNK